MSATYVCHLRREHLAAVTPQGSTLARIRQQAGNLAAWGLAVLPRKSLKQ